MLTKLNLLAVLNALESAQTEFEELMHEKEWYVTDVNDLISSAKEIVVSELEKGDKDEQHRV